MDNYLPCDVVEINSLENLSTWDTICVIESVPPILSCVFEEHRSFDKAFDSEVTCFKDPKTNIRIVSAPLGELDDFDDVRVYARASEKAISRAIKAGGKAVILVLPEAINTSGRFQYSALQTILGALHELYVPIQLREDVPDQKQRIEKLGVYHSNAGFLKKVVDDSLQFERGRFAARDIGGGDPERMAPPKVATYVENLFAKTNIKLTIISDLAVIQKDFPLFEAVNRAASSVARHNGRIIYLEYEAPQNAKKTVILVGKGVCYDTGGADIKAGGIMAGMSRDKCGAAFVGGFMKYVSETAPQHTNVIGVMCMVRNSVGEECYVADEVVTARSGARVRVGNTDAEGRMCMADALCEMKQRALSMPDSHLFTIATLTGHAHLAVGVGYSIVMDNGPAREQGHGNELKKNGDLIGDPFEISTLQREDFSAHQSKILGEDVIQANNLPSSRTPRGHQTPAAFMMLASGLDKHGTNSSNPLKYSHLDIAGSAGDHPDTPTGSPLLAIAKTHLI
ncbi:putative aminopeptidase W07G4.4 [Pseudolycoriella hygida]|uniref:Aminopeptidase W07G4.4 n=1 Tax=Pseudolycoriella hygida TaxID=35572 RepID=A0A9Q0RZ46_9DIPT|nr:putative aminopeptidase W07G4.4 [Pseudolycoriella hygida]